MTRILIRAGKGPFTPVSAEATLDQDVFNSNSGNYLFQHAVWETLAIDGTNITANSTLTERRQSSDAVVGRIAENFDHFVVPLANAFRPDFLPQLERLTEVIERLPIPVSVVGVGAQAPASLDLNHLDEVRDVTKRFVSAVLDRSPSIGVRGEFTQKFLLSLGFDDASVEVIGCPSLFRRGPDHQVTPRADSIADDARLALSLTPEVPRIGAFSLDQLRRHPNLRYIAQDGHDLRLMLWGVPRPNVTDLEAPVHLHHPLMSENRTRLFLDQWTWFDFLAEQDFAYGTRFHGTVAALMAGTPAVLLAHDSRTLELADYHHMPHRSVPAFDAPVNAAELYEELDLSGFHRMLPEGFARYTSFLETHGLAHRWQPGATTTDFDAKLAASAFPEAVIAVTSRDLTELVARLNWLRQATVRDLSRNPDRFEYEFEQPSFMGSGTAYGRLRDQHAKQRDQITSSKNDRKKLRDRITALERRIAQAEAREEQRLGRRIARKLRRSPGDADG